MASSLCMLSAHGSPTRPYMMIQHVKRSLLQYRCIGSAKSRPVSSGGWKMPPGVRAVAPSNDTTLIQVDLIIGNESKPIELQFKQRFTVTPGSLESVNNDMTGTWIWPTAKKMAMRLATDLEILRRDEPLRILELGSGCGLLGMTLAAIGHDVLLTDHAANIALLRDNVALNRAILDSRATTAQLGWGNETDLSAILEKHQPFDVIVGSDIIYDPNSHDALVETLRSFACRSGATFFLGYPNRDTPKESEFFQKAGVYFEIQVTPFDGDESTIMYAICRPR